MKEKVLYWFHLRMVHGAKIIAGQLEAWP